MSRDPNSAADQALADTERLCALVASRICHDLVNPVGSIANGVELLQLEGKAGGSEMALISDSVEGASTRLRFLRLALGAATESQTTGRTEVAQVLAKTYGRSRIAVQWSPSGDLPRSDVRLAFLSLMCCEAVLPRGGQIHVSLTGTSWRIDARGERVRHEPLLERMLSGAPVDPALRAADVQFALLPRALLVLRRTLRVSYTPSNLTLTY